MSKNTQSQSLSLVIDDRERAIIHLLEDENPHFPLIVQRITVGDYAIVDGEKLIAVIERKTLTDFGASLKDGRYHNKNDLIAARATTGCKCFYIIEGPLVNRPTSTFGGIPFDRIESAINHLMFRDDMIIINTANQIHTARRLISLVKSYATLGPLKSIMGGNVASMAAMAAMASTTTSDKNSSASSTAATTDTTISSAVAAVDDAVVDGIASSAVAAVDDTGDVVNNSRNSSVPKLITTTTPTSDETIVKNMWSTLRGISSISAEVFIDIPLSHIISGQMSIEQLKALKINHRLLGKQTLTSLILLSTGDKDIGVRLLGEIPGISVNTAKIILTAFTLKDLLKMDVPTISLISTGKNKIGMAKATNIHKYFNWSRTSHATGTTIL